MKKPITRQGISLLLHGAKISLRRVSFTDLARGEAYELSVEGIPSGVMSEDTYNQFKDEIDTIKMIKETYTYKGMPII